MNKLQRRKGGVGVVVVAAGGGGGGIVVMTEAIGGAGAQVRAGRKERYFFCNLEEQAQVGVGVGAGGVEGEAGPQALRRPGRVALGLARRGKKNKSNEQSYKKKTRK